MSGISAGIIGGLAAMTASTLTHPADSLKVRMFLHNQGQAGGGAGLSMVKTIYKTEGIKRGFYSGVTATWLRQALFSTSRFGVNDALQSYLKKRNGGKQLSVAAKIVSSATAGSIAASLSCPAEVVLVRMQADGKLPVNERRGYSNVFSGLRQIVRSEGVTQLYRGLRPLVARGCFVTAGQFTTYDVAKRALMERFGYGDSTRTHLMASTAAGTVSTLIVNPMDVIKSRMMQSQTMPANVAITSLTHYTSDWDCVVKTWKYEGVRGFYKGLLPCFMRQCPQVIFMWMIFEQYKRIYDSLTTQLQQPAACGEKLAA
ncbi:putative mitochondrial 2-oxoglutarate/malate carrier protein [Diplonema papillatum]|nr:putative mitochondrial 2-oxoglutarate/malate carrier protein [Diplonema papillatum]|eukprot:gene4739-7283_t